MQNRQNQVVLQILNLVSNYLHKTIDASNRTGSKKSNNFFAPLVLMCQNECDQILSHSNPSSLEKILQCAKTVEKHRAGNCMLQSYLALDYILKSFAFVGLATYDYCVPISIDTTKTHAFLCIDNQFICDPWDGEAYVIDKNEYQDIKKYFAINYNWSCSSNSYVDGPSTSYTFTLVKQLLGSTPKDEFFNQNKVQLLELRKLLAVAVVYPHTAETNKVSGKEGRILKSA